MPHQRQRVTRELLLTRVPTRTDLGAILHHSFVVRSACHVSCLHRGCHSFNHGTTGCACDAVLEPADRQLTNSRREEGGSAWGSRVACGVPKTVCERDEMKHVLSWAEILAPGRTAGVADAASLFVVKVLSYCRDRGTSESALAYARSCSTSAQKKPQFPQNQSDELLFNCKSPHFSIVQCAERATALVSSDVNL